MGRVLMKPQAALGLEASSSARLSRRRTISTQTTAPAKQAKARRPQSATRLSGSMLDTSMAAPSDLA